LFCTLLAWHTHLTPYFVQRSRSDERHGRDGSRSYFWAKDLTAAPKPLDITDRHLPVFIDVDYYVDMPAFLCQVFRPTLLYTMQPEQVSRGSTGSGDYSYTFLEDNRLSYIVNGGGQYEHSVWNYALDSIAVTRKFLGLPIQVAMYLVERRYAGVDHQLVLLIPVCRWTGPMAILASFIAGPTLDFIRPVVTLQDPTTKVLAKFLRMKVARADGLFMSTGIPGAYVSSTIPITTDDAIALRSATGSHSLQHALVRSYVQDAEEAALLTSFHRMNQVMPAPTVFPVAEGVRRYQVSRTFDDEAKPSLVAFMSPIVHGSFAPDRCYDNEEAAVRGRIVGVKSTTAATPFLIKVFMEFIDRFLPESQVLIPAIPEVVWEKQNRPTQRTINEYAVSVRDAPGDRQDHRMLDVFVKAESYPDVKDPRLISVLIPEDKVEYSMFMYALADHVKTQSWYAFGKAPAEIADIIVRKLSNALTASNSDFSRFDGTISPAMREFEALVIARAFPAQYVARALELHRSQFNLFACTTRGVKYPSGTARASGSPETAVMNSLVNAFVSFLAFRKTLKNGRFMDADTAWAALGIYGGDDGLTPDIEKGPYLAAAALCGLKLEVEVVQRHRRGVMFLSRVYGPDVWTGDNTSTCDLPRQLVKLHTTPVLSASVTPERKLLEKARSLYLTDRNTPIIGQFASKVVEIHGSIDLDPGQDIQPMRKWGSDVDLDAQYPNGPSDWMQGYADEALDGLGFDQVMFGQWLATAKTLTDLLSPPLCAPPPAFNPKQAVVVDGETFVPPKGLLPLPQGPDQNGRAKDKGERNKASRPAKAKKAVKRPTNHTTNTKSAKAKPARQVPNAEVRSG
jgi:hypothetical protein